MEQTSEAAISNLLNRISQIRQKHELVAELTGENFNVFRILGLQASENRTHSAFLRELLDPRGTHGVGDAFLKAFIRMLRSQFSDLKAFKIEQIIEDALIEAKVVAELHLGYKSEDLTKGGRVDLAITPFTGAWRIFIENKIYAGDQECQLVRYKNGGSNALLLYLTLNGDEASKYSTENSVSGDKLKSGVDYIPISYGEHILTWLEDCAKQASGRPLVRETIVQYAHLIRYLTHKNSSNLMTQEITKTVLSSKTTLLTFDSLTSSREAVRKKLLDSLEKELMNLRDMEGFSHPKSSIALLVPEILFVDPILELRNLGIGFGMEGGRWFFGFWRINPEIPDPGIEAIEKITKLFGTVEGPTKWWPVCRWWPEVGNWTWELARLADFYFEKTAKGQSPLVEEVSTQLKEMHRIALEVFEGS